MKLRHCLLALLVASGFAHIPRPAHAQPQPWPPYECYWGGWKYWLSFSATWVVPPTPSMGAGHGTVCWTAEFDSLKYVLAYNGLSSNRVSLEIHSGEFGVNGPLLLRLAGPGGRSDTLSGTFAATE